MSSPVSSQIDAITSVQSDRCPVYRRANRMKLLLYSLCYHSEPPFTERKLVPAHRCYLVGGFLFSVCLVFCLVFKPIASIRQTIEAMPDFEFFFSRRCYSRTSLCICLFLHCYVRYYYSRYLNCVSAIDISCIGNWNKVLALIPC